MSLQGVIEEVEHVLTVEEHLHNINYDVTQAYTPSDFALEFVIFIKLVNGESGEENITPLVHYKMLDTLIEGGNYVANLCHRGIAKTTLMGEYLILYLALHGYLPNFGPVSLVLYVSDSIDNGIKNMRKNLEHRWENSEFLMKYVPHKNLTDTRWEFANLDGHKLIVKGYGAKTGVRGTKELGTRPQLAILDDLVSDEDARSPTVIEKIEDTVYKAVTYALHPKKKKMVWSGTPFNAGDPMYKAVESGAWAVNVFPVCEEFPCKKEDFRSSWPDRFDYEYVLEQYTTAAKIGKIDTFDQELMLRIMSDEDRLIRDSDILWYKKQHLMLVKNQYNFYITTDFATSARQKADFSVISVWAYNNVGQWFWVDGECKRQTMDKSLNTLFRLAQIYKPEQVGIEVSGQQLAFISWITQEMIRRNIFFSLASDKNSNEPGIRPNTDKLSRFNVMVPVMKAKQMFFPEDDKDNECMVEMMLELRLASIGGFRSKHDDCIDTISMLGSLNPWRPSDTPTIIKGKDDDIYDFDVPSEGATRLSSYIV
jgi:phage terminase large subunit-like protein